MFLRAEVVGVLSLTEPVFKQLSQCFTWRSQCQMHAWCVFSSTIMCVALLCTKYNMTYMKCLLIPGKASVVDARDEHKTNFSQQTMLNKGLSKSMGFLAMRGTQGEEEFFQGISSDYNSGQEDSFYPYRCKTNEFENKGHLHTDAAPKRKVWASSTDLLCTTNRATERDHASDSHRHSHQCETFAVRTSTMTRNKEARYSDGSIALDIFGPQKVDQTCHVPETSTSAAISSAFDRIRERQKKLQLLREAMSVEG